jgi:type I restriction enzyme M protein
MTPKGGIRPHKRFSIQANRAEVLFVDYIADHLNINGKAGVIVPEGIIFNNQTAYKNLRKKLVEDYLIAVVSLPQGVFIKPGGKGNVKTGVLIFDKALAKKTKDVLFVKISNDGFDLGAQRRPTDKNDLPLALDIIKKFKSALKDGKSFELNDEENEIAHLASKNAIAETGDYNLTGERYKEVVEQVNQKWEMVELGEVCEILDSKRKPITKSDRVAGNYPYYGATGILDYVKDYIFDEKLVLIGEDGAKWGKGERTAFIADGKYWVNNHAHVLRPNRNLILDELLVQLINSMDLTTYVTGITVPKLNQANLRAIKILLPPIEVQKEIVEQIEVKQNAINHAKEIIKNLERERDDILVRHLEN